MKVKATKDFQFYRLAVMKVSGDGPNTFKVEMSHDEFRALQRGEAVDIDKQLVDRYKNCFEIVKSLKKEMKDG